MTEEIATFAAGCFWGVQAAFDELPGVIATRVGYTGGRTKNPTYKDVCTGETGHAEALEIRFDPARISYERLLEAFFQLHDPTTRNRQGPDVGTQYRSAIFCANDAQKAAADRTVAALAAAKAFPRPIVTEIADAAPFWPAEDYHQKYHLKHGGACR